MDQMKMLEWGMKINYYLVKYIWPICRILVKKKLSKRCSVCTLNENYVNIQDSVCDICREEKSKEPSEIAKDVQGSEQAKKELDELLSNAQGKGGGLYDAIFFFSGGKDSTYILNKLRMDYKGLRILAITIDNGFRSPVGKQNAEEVCLHFDTDHMEIRPYKMYKKLYKYGFENFSNRSFYCIDFWGGEFFTDIGRNLAVQFDVPLLILGYTPEQIKIIRKWDEYELYAGNDFKFKDNQKFMREKFVNVMLEDIFTPDEMRYWWDGSKCPEDKIPTVIFPFQAWGYNKAEIQKQISKLGIVKKKNMDAMLTNDVYCTLGVFSDYKIFGYCSVEPEWANLVRKGKEDKNQNRNLWECVEYLSLIHENFLLNSPPIQICLNKFGMTKKELNKIIKK